MGRVGPGPGALDPASAFQQQRAPAWRPLPTLAWAAALLLAWGALLLGVGFFALNEASSASEYVVRYDGAGTPAEHASCQLPADGGAPRRAATCTISITPTTTLRGPVSVLYQLHNLNQNHRSYVKSRLDSTLQGQVITDARVLADNCDPLVYAADGRILHPCGLIAQSWFNGEAAWWECTYNVDSLYDEVPEVLGARRLRG